MKTFLFILCVFCVSVSVSQTLESYQGLYYNENDEMIYISGDTIAFRFHDGCLVFYNFSVAEYRKKNNKLKFSKSLTNLFFKEKIIKSKEEIHTDSAKICFQYADKKKCYTPYPFAHVDSIDKNGNSYPWFYDIIHSNESCFKLFVGNGKKTINLTSFYSSKFSITEQSRIFDIENEYNYVILSIIPSCFKGFFFSSGIHKMKIKEFNNDTLKIKIPEGRDNFHHFIMFMPRSILNIPEIVVFQFRKIYNKDLRKNKINTFIKSTENYPLKKAIVLPSPYSKE